jgi:OOP family OmpA-OmpF porin
MSHSVFRTPYSALRIPHSVFLLFLAHALTAQNLVLNPGFETFTHESDEQKGRHMRCRFTKGDRGFDNLARGWTTFAGHTPDLLWVDSDCTVLQRAHGGQRCVGMINYLPSTDVGQAADYHEMIEGRLTAPLVPGRRYRVAFWVRTDTTIVRTHLAQVYSSVTPVQPVHAGNLGVWFTIAAEPFQQDFWRKIREEAIRPQVNFTEIVRTDGRWGLLEATFVPDRPFKHFVIGNFFYDAQTKNDLPPAVHREVEELNAMRHNAYGKTKRAAYLCLDDVSVTLDTPAARPVEPVLTVETALLKEKKYTFSAGVLFDSGSDVLRPEAAPELDALRAFLASHREVRLGIYGHTDNVGADAYNLDLSERRARAVYRYLADRGIAADRLRAKGWGEGKPVASNDNDDGRQRNRRVECRILE